MRDDVLTIPIIDTHLHLLDVKRMHYPWLDTVPVIRESFFIEDYRKAVKYRHVEKMAFVQADCLPDEDVAEVNFVEEQAQKDGRSYCLQVLMTGG